MTSIWGHLTRCKTLATQDSEKSQLARVLNLLELVILGVGSTLGLGVYVVAGSVAKTTAGPAVILSFVIAGIVTVLGGCVLFKVSSWLNLVKSLCNPLLGWSILALRKIKHDFNSSQLFHDFLKMSSFFLIYMQYIYLLNNIIVQCIIHMCIIIERHISDLDCIFLLLLCIDLWF